MPKLVRLLHVHSQSFCWVNPDQVTHVLSANQDGSETLIRFAPGDSGGAVRVDGAPADIVRQLEFRS